MDFEERKEWLERELGRKIPDPIWSALVRFRHVAGDMDETDEERLIEQARFGIEMRRRGFGRGKSDPPDWMLSKEDLRREVFSKCLTVAAEDHPAVSAFREEVLGESFPLTYDEALHYVDEDGHVRKEAPHARRLEELINNLAKTFLWRTHDASWFVLCSFYTPPVATFGIESKVIRPADGLEIGTIALTIEPWLPAEIVVAMYKKAQRQMRDKKPHQVSRGRLRLLEFVEMMGEGLSWSKRMNLWNELHPEEQYKDRSNFSKAYREARALVLEPEYTSEEQEDEAVRKDRRRSIKRKLKNIERQLRIIREVERNQRIVREAAGELP